MDFYIYKFASTIKSTRMAYDQTGAGTTISDDTIIITITSKTVAFIYSLSQFGHLNDFKSNYVITKRVNDVFLLYLADGVQHCNEHHKEYS